MPLITDSRDELEKYILACERDEAKRLTEEAITKKKAMMAEYKSTKKIKKLDSGRC